MKTIWTKLKKGAALACTALTVAFIFASCEKDEVNAGITYNLSGNATSGQVIPVGSSTSNGTATITGTYNSTTKVMSYTTAWSNLTGGPVAGGFFSGAAGQNGSSVSVWTLGSGLNNSGSISSSITLTNDQEAQLLNNNWYYLLSTSSNISGEVRGQVTATRE
ncbi:CHRD domain-containing protein [Sediminibacterium ginsengisoli]|uniref:CHRD domain-containing protein n=1 Tax=Sediminibacterium ginsengisoli TaxID=413434 RepID=A0A1T4QQ97_9BACT|nr:CHRD domain-containing protein [Sediminibacterium ginsengisoli]SKA05854.1 CHRD domain-containing protein [Sediminibacterium ginsengisoli]